MNGAPERWRRLFSTGRVPDPLASRSKHAHGRRRTIGNISRRDPHRPLRRSSRLKRNHLCLKRLVRIRTVNRTPRAGAAAGAADGEVGAGAHQGKR